MAKSRSTGRRWWIWLNVLSLDAPLVALVWQDYLHRSYASFLRTPVLLRPPGRVALGLTVWAIYIGDRILDVRVKAAEGESARHEFYRRHRRLAEVLLVLLVVIDGGIALFWLRRSVMWSAMLPVAAVGAYLAVFALLRVRVPRGKQVCAAILFVSGVFLIAWPQFERPWEALGWPGLAFGALCLGNLVLIEGWEDGSGSGRGWVWMVLLAMVCGLQGQAAWYRAVALSAVGLAALDLLRGWLGVEARRVLADVVLLTPLLFHA